MKLNIKPLKKAVFTTLMGATLWNVANGQQTQIDSGLDERISALEKRVADQRSGESHFMVVGVATFGYISSRTSVRTPGPATQSAKANSFGDAGRYELSPMLLWRHGTNLLVEFEPSFNGSTLGVNWANLSYFVTPGLVVHGGYFVVPFGIYNKKLAAGWINKFAVDPVGVALPGTDFGIGVSGGGQLGNMKGTYDVSLTNGLQLLPDGSVQNAGIVDNNRGKMVSGRFSLLPFSNSSLEVGVSGLYSKVGDDGGTHPNADAKIYGVDLNYVKQFNPILLNIKGQYNRIMVNRQTYKNPVDSSIYSFSNKTTPAFAQISIRPIGLPGHFVKNLEVAYRYVKYTTPTFSLWGQKYHEHDFALDYWLTWRTVLKFTYSLSKSVSTTGAPLGGLGSTTDVNSFFLQFSISL